MMSTAIGCGPAPAAEAPLAAGGSDGPIGTAGGAAAGGTAAGGAGGSGGGGSAGAVGSHGCGLAVSAGAQDIMVTAAGVPRRAIRVVPLGYDASRPHPLFIALHASGGTAESGRMKMQLEGTAPEPAIVVYPNGTPGASPTGLRGWNLDPAGPDVALFDALLTELEATLCIDLKRVVVVGFSNGAQLTNVLGCVRAAQLRMIASVAGTPGPTGCGADRVAAFLTAGENDPIVDLALAHQVRDAMTARSACAATAQSAPVTPCPPMTSCMCSSFDGCAAGFPVTYCQHSGGHDYPPFATAELWRLFRALPP